MAKRDRRNRSRGSSGNNKKTDGDFLAKNRKKEGVQETDSGLQYQIIDEGNGDKPDDKATVTIHQRCQLVNGSIIIDTYKENKHTEVKMEELIEGYREGILLMKKSARYKFFIPSELAWVKMEQGIKYHLILSLFLM